MSRSSLIRRPLRYSYNSLSIWLIAINVLVFALELIVPWTERLLAMTAAFTLGGAFWQPFTYMFVHDPSNLSHIIFNMLGLLIFGPPVEKELGSREFLLFYLLSGLLAGLFSLVFYTLLGLYQVPLLGASGALFAVLLAFATLQPGSQILIWGIIPVRAPIFALGYALIELVSQVIGIGGGVAHVTHLAGFGFAWLYFLARFGVNPWRRFFPRR